MDRRLDAGGLLVAVSALLLLVSLFVAWFGGPAGTSVTGWQAFETLDLVLAVAAIAATAAAFGRLPSPVLLGAVAVVALVVISQLIDPPPVASGAGRETGIWLALLATVGMAAGAALAAAQIAVTVDVRGRERRPRVLAVDRREARDPDAGTATQVAPERRGEPEGRGTERDPFARPGGSAALVDDPDATQAFPAPTEPSEPQP